MASSIQGSATTVQDQSSFDRQIASFKIKTQQFAKAYNALMQNQAVAAQHPALKAEWQALANRGFSLRTRIEYVTNKIDAAVNWFKSTFGDYDLSEDAQQLGFLPLVALIPLGLIAGVVAIINNYVSDVVLFDKKIKAAEQLAQQGIPPEEIAQIIEKSTPKPTGFLAELSPVVKWVAIGGAVFLVWQMTRGR